MLYLPLIFICLAGSASFGSTTPDLPKAEELNIILLLVDTFGAEYSGSNNPAIRHTPTIKKLSRQGVNFTNAYAAAPWTMPSVASIFTSHMPSSHKLTQKDHQLRKTHLTLSEHMKAKGFKTFGVVSHVYLGEKYGFSQGFDEYIELISTKYAAHRVITSRKVTNAATGWIDKNLAEGTRSGMFMFVHYFDPHYEYNHHKKFDMTSHYSGQIKPGTGLGKLREIRSQLLPNDIDYLKGLYQEEGAYVDFHIGRLIEHIEKSGLADNTLIIFTSDHGEEFMEHGWLGHTRTLYDELIRIPMFFYLPGTLSPGIVKTPVSQIDILPTLMSMFNEPHRSKTWEGISLKQYLEGGGSALPRRNLFSETSTDANLRSVIQGPYKLVHDKQRKKFTLYNRTEDPGEHKDISKAEPQVFKELKHKLAAWESSVEATSQEIQPRKVNLNSEEIKQLKSLGYIH